MLTRERHAKSFYPQSILFSGHHRRDVFLDGADGLDVEFLHQYLGYIGGKEGRQCGAQANALDAEEQQGQQHGHRFLLVPGDVVRDGQLIDVIQSECFLEFKGDHGQGVRVVALAGI